MNTHAEPIPGARRGPQRYDEWPALCRGRMAGPPPPRAPWQARGRNPELPQSHGSLKRVPRKNKQDARPRRSLGSRGRQEGWVATQEWSPGVGGPLGAGRLRPWDGLSLLLCTRGWQCPRRGRPRSACTPEGWLPFSHRNPRFSFPGSLSQSVSSQTLYSLISLLSFLEIPPENPGLILRTSHLMDRKTRPGRPRAHIASHTNPSCPCAVPGEGRLLAGPVASGDLEPRPPPRPAPGFAKGPGRQSHAVRTKSICDHLGRGTALGVDVS